MMADHYLSSGTLCGKGCGSPRRDEPRAEAQGDALIGGETTTLESGNEDAPAVAQQDATEEIQRWVPWPWLLLANAIAWSALGGWAYGVWMAMRRFAC